MNRQKNISVAIIFIAIFCTGTLFGQSKSPKKQYKDTFIVVKNFNPTIANAQKLEEKPEIHDTTKLIPKLSYSFLHKQAPVKYTPDTIPAAHIKGEPLIKLYRGYAKVGIGNNLNNLVDVYYNSLRSQDHNYGVRVHHFSSQGIHNVNYSGFSENAASVFAKKFYRKGMLYGNIDFSRNVVHLYGFPDSLGDNDTVKDKDFLKQRFTALSGKIGYNSSYTDSNVTRYQTFAKYRYYDDIFNDNEQYVLAHALFSKYYKTELYSLPVNIDYNYLSNTLDTATSMLFKLDPNISTNGKKWKLDVGLNIHVEAASSAKFHFYPHALFKYNVISNILIPYVGISGGVERVNYYSLSQKNSFIDPRIAIKNTNTKYNLIVGMRGTLSNYLAFNISFNNKKVADMPLFVKNLDDALQNRFSVIYDDVLLRHILAELDYNKVRKLSISLKGEYFNYTPTNELKIWYKPTLKLTASGTYNLVDKILIHASVYSVNDEYFRSVTAKVTQNGMIQIPVANKINGWVDANLGIEYRYTKKLSAFINFNNVASVKYQHWQDYPTQQFNVLGGLTYAF